MLKLKTLFKKLSSGNEKYSRLKVVHTFWKLTGRLNYNRYTSEIFRWITTVLFYELTDKNTSYEALPSQRCEGLCVRFLVCCKFCGGNKA